MTVFILSLPQEPGHTLLWSLSHSYLTSFPWTHVFREPDPGLTWPILREAPQCEFLSPFLFGGQHPEVDITHSTEEDPLGCAFLLPSSRGLSLGATNGAGQPLFYSLLRFAGIPTLRMQF